MPPISAHHGALAAAPTLGSPPLESEAIATSSTVSEQEGDARRLKASQLSAEARVDRRLKTDQTARRERRAPPPACGSLRLQPVLAHADVHRHRRLAVPYPDHLALDQLARRAPTPRRSFEQQLVVDRQDQPRLQP